ncbi:MAG TPA: Clp protease N-terminal domain-containing protein, partial [Candidatus Omnitrophota bacterium]|nr:Clp protease N-terminal domain-containing protein [Candidatus Omnitrophota bacterium]
MKLDKMTQKLKEALEAAVAFAQSKNHQQIEPEHLDLAFLRQEDSVLVHILDALAVPSYNIINAVEAAVNGFPEVSGSHAQPYFSQRLNKVFKDAEREAMGLHDEFMSVEHILLAEFSDPRSALIAELKKHNVSKDGVLTALAGIRGTQRVTDENPEAKYKPLEKYGRDLTQLANQGKLDPVIGRDDEIRRVIQVILRRTKNNPVLIGEAGVGKTAIVEGLAQRIAQKDVPEGLKNKKIIVL